MEVILRSTWSITGSRRSSQAPPPSGAGSGIWGLLSGPWALQELMSSLSSSSALSLISALPGHLDRGPGKPFGHGRLFRSASCKCLSSDVIISGLLTVKILCKDQCYLQWEEKDPACSLLESPDPVCICTKVRETGPCPPYSNVAEVSCESSVSHWG